MRPPNTVLGLNAEGIRSKHAAPLFRCGAARVPGHGRTALELGESAALFSLSSDGGGGEGRGEESRFYWISPLPNPPPLVPRRERVTDARRSNA